jgi:hypothetical protein
VALGHPLLATVIVFLDILWGNLIREAKGCGPVRLGMLITEVTLDRTKKLQERQSELPGGCWTTLKLESRVEDGDGERPSHYL